MRQSRILNHIAAMHYFHGRRLLYTLLAQMIPHDAVRSHYGVLLSKNPGDVTYRFSVLGKYGDFLQKIIEKLPTNGTFVDVGANQGVFTLIAAQHLKNGHVFALEPNPEIHQLLIDNLAINNIRNATAVCAALCGKGQKFVELTFNPTHSGAASLTGGQGKKVRVRAVDRDLLDKFADDCGSEVLIKVDVEGAEAVVLEELFSSHLGRIATDLVVELSQQYHDATEIAAIDKKIRLAGFEEASRRGREEHYDAHYVKVR